MRFQIGRRSFLTTAAAGALALPVLRSLRATAQDAEHPTRLIVFHAPEGVIHQHWNPAASAGRLGSLGTSLAALTPFREKLNVVAGIEGKSSTDDEAWAQGHGAMPHFLTGTRARGPVHIHGADWPTGAGGISVDQTIAARISAETAFPSLQVGVQNGAWTDKPGIMQMSSRGPGDGLAHEDNPYDLYDRLFGSDFTPDDPRVARRLLDRRSVLDAVSGDLGALSSALGRDDRVLLDAHLTSIREVERRLDPAISGGAVCTTPELGDRIDHRNTDNVPLLMQLQTDLMVAALACDRTRVLTFSLAGAYGYGVIPRWLNDGTGAPITEDFHEISHNAFADGAEIRPGNRMDKRIRIQQWLSEQFAYLLERLDAIPEGDGTMLDHSLVVWASSWGHGGAHTSKPWGWVLAGGASGRVRTGNYHVFGETVDQGGSFAPHNRMLISMCHAMGLDDISEVGDPAYCADGPLPGLAV